MVLETSGIKRKFRGSPQQFNKLISIMCLLSFIFLPFMYDQNMLGFLKISFYLCCKYLLFLFYFFVSHLALWLSQGKLFNRTIIQSALQLVYGICFEKQQKLPTLQSPCAIFWLIKYYDFASLILLIFLILWKKCLKESFNLKLFNFIKSLSVVFLIFHGHMMAISDFLTVLM